MPVKDQDAFQLIERIQQHYHNNINNRYVKKALLYMKVPREVWERVDHFMEKSEYYKLQGYGYQELYEAIHACAVFVHHARLEVLPNIRGLSGSEGILSRGSGTGGESERILRQMAVENFGANLGVFADLVNELYVKTVDLDKQEHLGRRPVYERLPELKELGQLLV